MTVIVLAAMLPAGSADSFALEESEITVPETIQAEPNPLVEEPLPRTELDVQQPDEASGRRALPPRYHLKDEGLVTSVKDQENYGICWAMAAISCAETSVLKNYGKRKIDLSEAHLAHFIYNRPSDPLGNTQGDRVILDRKEDYLNMGGDDKKTLLALAGWTGAARESVLSMKDLTAGGTGRFVPQEKAWQNSYTLKNGFMLPADSERETIKRMILKYGSLNAALYTDPFYFESEHMEASYCDVPEIANHEVCIVGWDDTYSRDKFKDGTRPQQDGAWIVKNSWGTGYHKAGYFYLSYEDKSLCDLIAYEFQPADTYDHNYQYDGNIYPSYLAGIENGGKFANVYEVKGESSGRDEILKAVGLVTYTPGMKYSVQIYKDLKDKSDPESGTPMLEEPAAGTAAFAGFITKELPEELVLSQGTRFSIVITVTDAGDNGTIGTETEMDTGGAVYHAEVSPRQSFMKAPSGEGAKWEDLYEYGACLRIKGFTEAADNRDIDIKRSENS